MRYIDSSRRDPSETMAGWLGSLPSDAIRELRVQSGFFSAEPLGLLAPLLSQLATANAPTRLLLGSNGRQTTAEDLLTLIEIVGSPRSNLRVGVVDISGGLFHPKVIHVVDSIGASAYVGSANLTGAGSSGQNVEAGVILASAEGDSTIVLEEIRTTIDAWFDGRHGVRIIESREDVQGLLEEGLLSDLASQLVRRSAQQQDRSRRQRPAYRVGRIVRLPGVPIQASDYPAVVTRLDVEGEVGFPETQEGGTWRLVWRSSGLTRRDLNIPTGSGTNPTGSMGLKRGDWEQDIDHRHYFRDVVFADLEWHDEAAPHHESAEADVELWIGGASIVSARVVIAHNRDTSSRTYEQRNFMSAIRWGGLREYVASEGLLGQTLRLEQQVLAGEVTPPRFRISIDPE